MVGVRLCDGHETRRPDDVLGADVGGSFRAGEDEQFARRDVVPG